MITETRGSVWSGTGQKRRPGGGSACADQGTALTLGWPTPPTWRMMPAPSLPLSAPILQGNQAVQSPSPGSPIDFESERQR